MTFKIPSEKWDMLSTTLQKEGFLQLSEQMKSQFIKNNLKEGDLYNDIPKVNRGHKNRTDRDIYHSDYRRIINLKITKHNPMLFPPKFLNRLSTKLGMVPSDSAIWLTQYFYQFFFIDMAKYDLTYAYNDEHPEFLELNKPEDITKSFAHLRRGLELLLAPIALPLATYDHTLLRKFKFKSSFQDNYLKEQRILLKIWLTEGFSPNTIGWVTDTENLYYLLDYWTPTASNPRPLENSYDTYPVLSNLFVALFANDASELLKKQKYAYTKPKQNNTGQRFSNNFLKRETLLDFFCKDFPNLVTHKIIDLLQSGGPSSQGWEIYNLANEVAKNYAIESESGINLNIINIASKIFNGSEWNSWYNDVLNSSKVYKLNQSLITYDELDDLFKITK